VFGIPESAARLLPADLDGAAVVELGCGTGYVSAWLQRRGARPVGVDPTAAAAGRPRQLGGCDAAGAEPDSRAAEP
jgi:SAM-dependent methyltransferase